MPTIVIPAFNEEKSIGRVIRGLFEHGLKDVVVVDDGSSDDTSIIAGQAGAMVLKHVINRGQGAALETGDSYARLINSELVVHFDADGQFNPDDIQKAIDFMMGKQLDVLLGSRFLDNRSNIPCLKKHFILPIGRWINFLFTGCMLTDAHNGFRILSRKALEKIVITQDGMAHNTEIVKQIKKNRLRYAEFPVEVRYSEYGQGLGGGIRIIQDLIIGLFS